MGSHCIAGQKLEAQVSASTGPTVKATCANGKITGVVCSCNPGYEGGGVYVSGPTYPACVAVDYCAKGANGLGPCQNGGTCRTMASL